ncbi:MAG TPA: hypothetical protein VK187_04335, partial [Geobacteraceae bacterium]|nr:hypothetical protein [Geobacteraceae bacterium]
MVNNKIHLRDTSSNTDAEFAWDPMAPDFSGMDTFCLSCHDANGAVSTISVRIQAYINTNGLAAPGKTASPTNPFGDTISNQYDRLERPAVVNAKSQFNTSNPSHHAVLGKRYSGRTRAGVADPAGFTSNSSANLPGTRTTIFEAGKFEATYITLANAAGEINTPASLNGRNGGTALGDDSTLHCGDCHTVGQYRAADAAPGNRYNKAVIGAHGSNNEYMLRNNLGTDERHTGAKFAGSGNFGADLGFGNMPYMVCFNCHVFTTYGSAFGTSGAGHASEYDQDGRCNGAGQTINNVFGPVVGLDRLQTYEESEAKYGQPEANSFGNIFGMECNNCHNSGINGNMFGGIHGAAEQTYIDGMGNTTKHARFFPGLGNSMFVPGVRGGFTGGTVATYLNYSGNRNGTGTGGTSGQTFTTLPVRNTKPADQNGNGSYQYVTGGVGSDLNWEQKAQ